MKTLKIDESTHTSLWMEKIELKNRHVKGIKTLDDVIKFHIQYSYNQPISLEDFIDNWNNTYDK